MKDQFSQRLVPIISLAECKTRHQFVAPFFDDSNQNVGRHGVPDMRIHGVLAVALELLDAKGAV